MIFSKKFDYFPDPPWGFRNVKKPDFLDHGRTPDEGLGPLLFTKVSLFRIDPADWMLAGDNQLWYFGTLEKIAKLELEAKTRKIEIFAWKTKQFFCDFHGKLSGKNSVILVSGFFRYLVNKKLCRRPFSRYYSKFRYLGFRYSSWYLYSILAQKFKIEVHAKF